MWIPGRRPEGVPRRGDAGAETRRVAQGHFPQNLKHELGNLKRLATGPGPEFLTSTQ